MGIATRNIIAASHPRQNRKYSIIIPAAGIGSRMKKYGAKPLIQVNKTDNIIERQLKIINKVFRWYEIILVTGFQHDKIENIAPSKIQIVYNNEYETTNVIHSINLGLQKCTTDNIIILYGDLVFNKSAINLPFDTESVAVISEDMKNEEIGCNIYDGYIEHMFYGLENKWGHILFLVGLELKLMKEFCSKEINSRCYGFEAVNYIINHQGKIKAIKPKGSKIMDIDTSLDIDRIHELI